MVFNFSKYRQLQKDLFPNIVEKDYLRHYFNERITLNNERLLSKREISSPLKVSFGEDSFVNIKLKPTRGVVKRFGDEFCNSVLTSYSREYWLVALWITMYEDSKHNDLAREILRAFIKTCICKTSNHMAVATKKEIVTNKDVKSLLPDQLEFYNIVFSSQEIFKNMRRPYRSKLKMHSSEQSIRKMGKSISLPSTLDISDSAAIFNNAGLSDYSTLIKLSSRYAKTEEIKTITRAISMFLNNLRGKKLLQREISTLIVSQGGKKDD